MFYLLRSRRVLAALWACLLQASLQTSFDAVLPLFVRSTFHWDSLGAGLIYLPLVMGFFLGPAIGAVSDKHGARWIATSGFLIACPALILLRLVQYNTLVQKGLLCVLLAIIGFSLALVWTPIMVEIAFAVDAEVQKHPEGFFGTHGGTAQAYGLTNLAWASGGCIGPLVAGMTVTGASWDVMTLILGCLSILGAIPTAIWTGSREEQADFEGHSD